MTHKAERRIQRVLPEDRQNNSYSVGLSSSQGTGNMYLDGCQNSKGAMSAVCKSYADPTIGCWVWKGQINFLFNF